MMDLLLDTHVAIWWMEGSDRLGPRCKATLFRPGARLWISTVSVWEMAIKSGLGRLKLSTPLDECIPDLFARGALCLPISLNLSLIHISEPTRLGMISYAVFCLKKKK